MELLFVYISIFSAVIPISVGITTVKKHSPISAKILLTLLFFSFAVDITANVLSRIYGFNYWIINVYLIIELILILSFFIIELDKVLIIAVIGAILTCLLIWQISTIGLSSLPYMNISLNNLIQILLSLWLYYRIFTEGTDVFIENSFLFWFNTGILVYASGSLFTYLLSTEILAKPSLMWVFHNIANILKNLLFAIGLWKIKRAI